MSAAGTPLEEKPVTPLYPLLYEDVVHRTLSEDLGRAGDLSADSVIPPSVPARASIVARQAGRIAGLDVAALAFRCLDPNLAVTLHSADGRDAVAGEPLATVEGAGRSVLSAERTALNFLGHLSGVATATREFVAQVAGTRARVVCTRKTTPGLRTLEKYAVRCGGGFNHRFGLDDAVMIKDNHIAVAGGIEPAVRRTREFVGHMVKLEVEVDTLEQLDVLLPLGVDVVLLDNMSPAMLTEAVARVRTQAPGTLTEASGGITPNTAAAVAASGVDLLSVGWITHSAPRLDVALDILFDSV